MKQTSDAHCSKGRTPCGTPSAFLRGNWIYNAYSLMQHERLRLRWYVSCCPRS